MGAPATQGRLCTKLEQMEIGDYIRCTYTAPTANVAGGFSDLGGAVVETKELPTTPIETPDGYFYYLKVDKGLLVADRMVQSSISAQALNLKNYLNGNEMGGILVRCLSQAEWTKYLTNGDMNGCILKQDVKVWNAVNMAIKFDSPTEKATYNLYTEYTHNRQSNVIRTAMNINGMHCDDIHHISIRKYWASDSFFVGIYVSSNESYKTQRDSYTTRYSLIVNEHYSFRPVIEYVDNLKSKTIWY